jgi:hypothetical protein
MAANRFQVSAAGDSILPRDRFVNTLYFEDIGTSDQDGLCLDLAHIFDSFWYSPGNREIVVKSYEVGPPPNFPIGEAILNPGLAPISGCPREVSLCLSFYAGQNVPRKRGRIYLSIAAASIVPGVRPSGTVTAKALALGDKFAALGGADVSWNVHSHTTGEDHEVSNVWVDDEWDTVRSRGLRATTRVIDSTGS